MKIIDSHTHIYSSDFDEDRHSAIERALALGVQGMVLPAIDQASFESMHQVQADYPQHIHLCLGLHPTHVGEDYRAELDFVYQHIRQHPYVAVGEIGLDYYWDTTYKAEQQQAFDEQIRLALELNLPIIIHTREAFPDTFAILDRYRGQGLRGVFHSFTGSEAELDEALSFEGFMVGLNGVVTFKNSPLRHYVGRIPMDRLLVETDAPYLSPVPKRGKRNEPAHILHTLEHLTQVYGISMQELSAVTTANAERLFSLI